MLALKGNQSTLSEQVEEANQVRGDVVRVLGAASAGRPG